MVGATWLARDFHVRQRSLLARGRAARLQSSELKPFDRIYMTGWGGRRTIADVAPMPQGEYDLQIRLIPRSGRRTEFDTVHVNFEDWFTVTRRRTRTVLWRWAFGAPRWEAA